MGRKNYPSHAAKRKFRAEYRDKRGNLIRATRSSTILRAIRNIPHNVTARTGVAEVEIYHIDDRKRHPEALATVHRSARRLDVSFDILRSHLT